MPNKHTMQVDLTGKVALVTGASQGLGAYYAGVLAKNGASVVMGGRSMEKLNNISQKISEKGSKAHPLILDMTDLESFDKKIDEIVQRFGSIDILINNAAASVDRGMFAISPSDWDLHMDTNLKGLFFLSQSVAKQMKIQKDGGNIINIAAINGDHIRKNCIPFSVSKAGVIHLTKAMAYELIDYKVNALSLGLFASEAVSEWLHNDPKAGLPRSDTRETCRTIS
jgi:NAD(P)-dependent dehydrogenase (short-subunit alcohol dehydrogenase family)